MTVLLGVKESRRLIFQFVHESYTEQYISVYSEF